MREVRHQRPRLAQPAAVLAHQHPHLAAELRSARRDALEQPILARVVERVLVMQQIAHRFEEDRARRLRRRVQPGLLRVDLAQHARQSCVIDAQRLHESGSGRRQRLFRFERSLHRLPFCQCVARVAAETLPSGQQPRTKSPMRSIARSDSGMNGIPCQPCGIRCQTSTSAATPAARARSTQRLLSSSRISVLPTWNNSGGSPREIAVDRRHVRMRQPLRSHRRRRGRASPSRDGC